jgi:NAD+ diphosphatase
MGRDAAFFRPGVEPPEPLPGDSLVFAFRGEQLVVATGEEWRLPTLDLFLAGGQAAVYLGAWAGGACLGLELDKESPLPAGFKPERLRNCWGKLPDALYATAGFAWQIVHWNATHRFCGRCGEATTALPGERAKKCPRCFHVAYPRLSPVVIVLVRKGDSILLARPQNAAYYFFSALAGFVEPGETLEQAVCREIHEEASIEIGELRYFSSQPWPYPHSLMIGFFANWQGGELHFDSKEIAEGGFYPIDQLPPLPGKLSIARALIDAAVAEIAAGR